MLIQMILVLCSGLRHLVWPLALIALLAAAQTVHEDGRARRVLPAEDTIALAPGEETASASASASASEPVSFLASSFGQGHLVLGDVFVLSKEAFGPVHDLPTEELTSDCETV